MGATDLTRSEHQSHPQDRGTGIYWLINASGETEQIFSPNVTRDQSSGLAGTLGGSGWTVDAYRWVPEHVQDAASLIGQPCGGTCTSDLGCVNNACRCIQGRCSRK